MWKKDRPTNPIPRIGPPRPARAIGELATIGPAISIRGDISGAGDLVIEGRVTGAIQFERHDVTVSSAARVEADIHGRRICVDGMVTGDLFGEEVVIRESGRVKGNATAAKVTLENGCSFSGIIDMRPENGHGTAANLSG